MQCYISWRVILRYGAKASQCQASTSARMRTVAHRPSGSSRGLDGRNCRLLPPGFVLTPDFGETPPEVNSAQGRCSRRHLSRSWSRPPCARCCAPRWLWSVRSQEIPFSCHPIAFAPPTVAFARTSAGGPTPPGTTQANSPSASVLQVKIAIDAKYGTVGFCDMFKAHDWRRGPRIQRLGPAGLSRRIVEAVKAEPDRNLATTSSLPSLSLKRGKGGRPREIEGEPWKAEGVTRRTWERRRRATKSKVNE